MPMPRFNDGLCLPAHRCANRGRSTKPKTAKPFTYGKRTARRSSTGYYTLPERLYDEPDELEVWARRAYDAARQSPSAQKKRVMREREAAQGRKSPAPPAARVRTELYWIESATFVMAAPVAAIHTHRFAG